MEGNANPCQSSDDPLRTINALLNAANIMVTAKSTTQMAVEEGGGEYSSATRTLPSDGRRFPQSPLPDCLWRGKRRGSICGGSWTVVAITNDTPLRYSTLCDLRPRLIVASYCSSLSVFTCSGEVCIT